MAITVALAALKKLAPKGDPAILAALHAPLNAWLPQYGITTPLRVQHFLAQAAHETDGFKTLVEYASGKAYEGRKDLGNVALGDGARFRGRGIFQLTGRANYEAYGRRLGIDLIGNPARAANPDVAVRVACEYWKAKGLNAWADRDDLNEITRRINGGYNGLKDRAAYLSRAKALFRDEASPLPVPRPAEAPLEEVPDAPIAAEPSKKWFQSTEIWAVLASAFGSLLSALSNPYALGGFALLLALGAAVWIAHRRMQREAAAKPTA